MRIAPESTKVQYRNPVWGERTLADDIRAERRLPSPERHVHFHQHGSHPRHAHEHAHNEGGWEHAHSTLT